MVASFAVRTKVPKNHVNSTSTFFLTTHIPALIAVMVFEFSLCLSSRFSRFSQDDHVILALGQSQSCAVWARQRKGTSERRHEPRRQLALL